MNKTMLDQFKVVPDGPKDIAHATLCNILLSICDRLEAVIREEARKIRDDIPSEPVSVCIREDRT